MPKPSDRFSSIFETEDVAAQYVMRQIQSQGIPEREVPYDVVAEIAGRLKGVHDWPEVKRRVNAALTPPADDESY